jgi:serine/threonine protein kinase
MSSTPCPVCGAATTPPLPHQLARCPGCSAEFLPAGASLLEVPTLDSLADPRTPSTRRISLTASFRKAYELGRVLGRGAASMVFQARRLSSNDLVAVKFLLASDDPRLMARFEREGKVLRALDHPKIVTLFEVGQLGGSPYLVMELMRGGTLGKRIAAVSRLPWREGIAVLLECLEGLQACHDRGVVHRDLKPENVLLTVDGKAKLSDFGVARAYVDAYVLTRSGDVLGTPRYLSPEQARGEKVSPASDLFAFGILAYEVLTGANPFAGPTLAESIAKLLFEAAVPLRVLAGETPSAAATIIQQCLSKKPEDRPKSAQDIAVVLRSSLDGQPPRTTGQQRIGTVGPQSAMTHPVRTPAGRVLILAVLLTILALLVWVGARFVRPGEAAPTTTSAAH